MFCPCRICTEDQECDQAVSLVAVVTTQAGPCTWSYHKTGNVRVYSRTLQLFVLWESRVTYSECVFVALGILHAPYCQLWLHYRPEKALRVPAG